jgi:hypothetical protein
MENGTNNNASGYGATAEGLDTSAIGMASHAEGYQTNALATSAHAEGSFSNASGSASHAEGYQTQATEESSHAEGNASIAAGIASHAEGLKSVASGEYAHAEGLQTVASGNYAHAEGWGSIASSRYAHVEGRGNIASGVGSHVEGADNEASGSDAHSEGNSTKASGISAHAEGSYSVASGLYSHSEGRNTTAASTASHAEGQGTTVLAEHSFSHIMGRYGQTLYPSSWHLAYGDVFGGVPGLVAVLEGATGNLYIDGTVMSPAADYAEMFETVDGLPLEPGYFVTLEEDKIRKVTTEDDYVLGIVSGRSSVVGGAHHLNWQGKYVTDEWGRIKYEEVQMLGEDDVQGDTLMETKIKAAVLNSEFDASRSYVPRIERPEWVTVGLIGKLLVRDDGTCVKNGYCRPNRDGIATAASSGYRVVKRTGSNQILIIFVVK